MSGILGNLARFDSINEGIDRAYSNGWNMPKIAHSKRGEKAAGEAFGEGEDQGGVWGLYVNAETCARQRGLLICSDATVGTGVCCHVLLASGSPKIAF